MSAIIPFGPFHPDSATINAKAVIEARNVLPAETGFAPLKTAVASTLALPSEVRGAVSVLLDDGDVETFAGTSAKLWRLNATGDWEDVSGQENIYDDSDIPITTDESEAVLTDSGDTILADDGSIVTTEELLTIAGDDYSVGAGEQWKYALYGTLLLATNIVDGIQKYEIGGDGSFAPLDGSPPKARYIDIVREFVFLGAIEGNEKRVQWSANGDAESWSPGVRESDYQDFPNGGPVRGVVGGETAYVFQAAKVTRGTYVPGSPLVFQFDEVEGAAGLAAPHSLVRLRSDAFYLASDGFRRFDLRSASSITIGAKKWLKWFQSDKKQGTEFSVLGAANPVRPIIVWAYCTTSNLTTIPDRLLIYDWSLDEATYADLTVETLIQWLSPGLTMDTINDYGSMETLPYSLDSPFWRGGAQLMGLFLTDHKLSLQSGSNMAATLTTADGQPGGRMLFKGVRPAIDTSQVTTALAVRERDADAISFGSAEAMEDTGICPAHKSGNIVRAQFVIPAGATWTAAKGLDTIATRQGMR